MIVILLYINWYSSNKGKLQTIKEPIVREADSAHEALIGDISARGVWQPQATTVFDVQIIDSDAPLYLSKPVEAVL